MRHDLGTSGPVRRGAVRWGAVAATLGLLAGVSALAVTAALVLRRGPEPAPAPPPEGPPDPRLEYAGPLRNVRPGVAYVGDAACAGCHTHDKECASYSHHPMGRSLFPVARAELPLDAGHRNPFEAFGSRFTVERRGERLFHRQARLDDAGKPVYEFEAEAHYVIGSGENGCSFLTERDGYVFQTAVSWFSQKQIWDTSPSFSRELLAGRPVSPLCLFCHANQTVPVAGSLNRYEKPVFRGLTIGCERCHGPGGLHVESGDALDIVHPGKLEPALRDAVCEQCHLQGEARVVRRGRSLYDFRPGLPLEAFHSIFVQAGTGKSKAVNHVEQMRQSRCYQATAGPKQMGCVSCHDPHAHVGPAERPAYYRARCLNCHGTGPECSVPEAQRRLRQKDDSCAACHMPRYPTADIVHTAATDHRIVRRPQKPAGDAPGGATPHLASFHRGPVPADDPELARDLGIALAGLAISKPKSAAQAAAMAVPLLEEAARRHPDDLEAWEAKGRALTLAGRGREGLAAFETVLAAAPRRELALAGAATLAQLLDRLDPAIGYWRQAVEANPYAAAYRGNLARLLAHKGDWAEARVHCQAWLELDPGSTDARELWVRCLVREGRKEQARAEFARLERLGPSNLAELRAWFAVHGR